MLKTVLCILACLLSELNVARAIEAECLSREQCELQILAACPEGATILKERLLPGGGELDATAPYRYVTSYTCGEAAAEATPTRSRNEAATQSRLFQLRQLEDKRAKVRMVGPVLLTLVGTGLTGTALTFSALAKNGKSRAAGLVVSIFPATFLLLPGAVWLRKSVRERRNIKREIDLLGGLELGPTVALAVDRHGAALNLAWRL